MTLGTILRAWTVLQPDRQIFIVTARTTLILADVKILSSEKEGTFLDPQFSQ
jgi:hypothetical protein